MSARVEPACCPNCGAPEKWTTEDDGTPVQIGYQCMYEDDACPIIANLRGRLRAVEPVVEAAVHARKLDEALRKAIDADPTKAPANLLRAANRAEDRMWAAVDVYRRGVAPDRNAEADHAS